MLDLVATVEDERRATMTDVSSFFIVSQKTRALTFYQ